MPATTAAPSRFSRPARYKAGSPASRGCQAMRIPDVDAKTLKDLSPPSAWASAPPGILPPRALRQQPPFACLGSARCRLGGEIPRLRRHNLKPKEIGRPSRVVVVAAVLVSVCLFNLRREKRLGAGLVGQAPFWTKRKFQAGVFFSSLPQQQQHLEISCLPWLSRSLRGSGEPPCPPPKLHKAEPISGSGSSPVRRRRRCSGYLEPVPSDPPPLMQHIIENHPDMATALLAGEKLKELILPGQQDDKTGSLAALLLQLKLELPFDRVVTIGTVLIPIVLVTLVFTKNFAEEPIYCYTPHNFTRDQALYARGYCWTELRDALPGLNASHWPSLFEHKFLPYALLAFAGIMYIPALGWEFLASTRLTSELNFLLQEIDNCYHRAAEGRAPKIEKQIQSKGPGITERERREIIENAEKEKSPEQNLFEKYLERRGRSNFLAKLYLARHLFIIFLSIIPITYLSTYYATQKQNEFTCALGEPPDKTSNSKLLIRVNCKLPSVQLQRIIAGVDIVLLCFMNLIILINLIHLFIFRKSNFIFDKLNKVGIKTKKQWQKSQFCDINILAMFCNENRDHIKSLNRLDFITNESDLMYDNVVRQLLAALAQSNHDVTPTVRDSGIQTIDPSINPTDLDPNEPLIIKRPRKKMKWMPSSNPLPQPFKEQLATMKVENSKPEKPKPVRRKTAADSLIAPLLETNSKSIQPSPVHKTEPSTLPSTGNEKKHTRHFSLDVHPYILSNKKPKQEIPSNNSVAISKSQESGFLNQENKAIVCVTSSLKDSSLPGKESLYSRDICRTVPATGVFLTCAHNHIATSGAATKASLPQTNKVVESGPALNCHPVHPLLHINTLYEDPEEEGSNLIDDSLDNRIHSPPESGDIISMPSTKQIMLATFDEPLAIVNSAEY